MNDIGFAAGFDTDHAFYGPEEDDSGIEAAVMSGLPSEKWTTELLFGRDPKIVEVERNPENAWVRVAWGQKGFSAFFDPGPPFFDRSADALDAVCARKIGLGKALAGGQEFGRRKPAASHSQCSLPPFFWTFTRRSPIASTTRTRACSKLLAFLRRRMVTEAGLGWNS